jgi:hypothetical protein
MNLIVRVFYNLLIINFFFKGNQEKKTMGKKGLEPLTLRLSSVYSSQLSYLPFNFIESFFTNVGPSN